MKPEYTNEFDKPVYKVGNAHIKKVPKQPLNFNKTMYGAQYYELQLNNQYFLISEDILNTLNTVTKMSSDISVSIG